LQDLIKKVETSVTSLYMLLDTDNFDSIEKVPVEESSFHAPSIVDMCEEGVKEEHLTIMK